MPQREAPRRASREEEREAEARRIIERVERDSETIGAASLSRTANQVARHFLGKENPRDDAIEVWGKRIARILALIAFVALLVHLYLTYVIA